MAFNRILIAVDSGAPATRAAQVGCDLAGALGAQVKLVHAFEPPSYVAQTHTPTEEFANLADEDGEKIFSALLDQMVFSVPVSKLVCIGEPAETILQAASEWAADLIVIGSHGRDGLTRALLGSIAERVMRNAACPVLVIKAT